MSSAQAPAAVRYREHGSAVEMTEVRYRNGRFWRQLPGDGIGADAAVLAVKKSDPLTHRINFVFRHIPSGERVVSWPQDKGSMTWSDEGARRAEIASMADSFMVLDGAVWGACPEPRLMAINHGSVPNPNGTGRLRCRDVFVFFAEGRPGSTRDVFRVDQVEHVDELDSIRDGLTFFHLPEMEILMPEVISYPADEFHLLYEGAWFVSKMKKWKDGRSDDYVRVMEGLDAATRSANLTFDPGSVTLADADAFWPETSLPEDFDADMYAKLFASAREAYRNEVHKEHECHMPAVERWRRSKLLREGKRDEMGFGM